MTQQREEGKILAAYSTPIGYIAGILNYDSADEWVKDQINTPIINYMEWEVYPLADAFESLKGTVEALKAMTA